jgi:hypothetical protein
MVKSLPSVLAFPSKQASTPHPLKPLRSKLLYLIISLFNTNAPFTINSNSPPIPVPASPRQLHLTASHPSKHTLLDIHNFLQLPCISSLSILGANHKIPPSRINILAVSHSALRQRPHPSQNAVPILSSPTTIPCSTQPYFAFIHPFIHLLPIQSNPKLHLSPSHPLKLSDLPTPSHSKESLDTLALPR